MTRLISGCLRIPVKRGVIPGSGLNDRILISADAPLLRHDPAVLGEAIVFSPPMEIAAEEAHHPYRKALQITKWVEPAQAQPSLFPQQSPSNGERLNHTV
jgi:hypothetical protein